MSSSPSSSSANVNNTIELHTLNLFTLNSSETEPRDNLKRDSLIDNNVTKDEGVQPIQSEETKNEDECIANTIEEEKVENVDCLMSDNDLLDMLGEMEQMTSNEKTESVRRSIDDIVATCNTKNNNSIILNFDPLNNVSQNRDSLQLCESIDKLPQQSVDNNVVVTQEAESGQPVQFMENVVDNEFIVNMNEEAEVENIGSPINDNHFLSMLEQLEHMTTNKKAKSIRRSVVNNNNINNNSIILNFDPLSNIASQSRDSLKLCESVDKSLQKFAVITPQSVDTDKSSASSSRFNRTGHLISPLFCEDYIRAANNTPTQTTQVVSPLQMSNENNDVIETNDTTDPTGTTTPTKTADTATTTTPPPLPPTTTSTSSNAIQSFTEVTTSASTNNNLLTSSFNVSSSAVMLNKSFTKLQQTTTMISATVASTSPLIRSPWRNRSVLCQALGGGGIGCNSSYSDGDSSPEWLSFSTAMNKKPQKGSVMLQQGGQLNYDDEGEDAEKSFNAEGFLSHINKQPSNNDQCLLNTIEKKKRSAELDLLVGMLNRVEVKDDDNEKEEGEKKEDSKKSLVDEEPSPSLQQQRKDTENQVLPNPELNVNAYVTPEIKVRKQITPSLTYDVVKPKSSGKCLQKKKREATVIGVSQASPIYSTESLLMITNPNDAVSISTPIYEHEIDKNSCSSRRRRSVDELNTTFNISNNINSTNGNTSYTGGGISGFLAKAVRSVYSHLMSSSLAVSQTSILSPPEDNSALIAGKHQHINTVDTSKVNSINDTSPLEVEKGNEEEELAVKNAVNTTHNLIKDEGGVAVVFDDDENDKHSVEIRKERENQSRSIKSFTSTSLPHTQSMSYEQQLQQHQQKYEDVVSIEDEVWKTVSSVHDDNGDVDVDADAGGNGNIDNSGDNKSSRTYSMEISNYESSEIDNILEGENKENMKVSQVTTTAAKDIKDVSMKSEEESVKVVTPTPTSTMPESRQALKEVSVNHKLGDTFDMGGDYNTFAASANNNSSNASFSESQYEYKETSMMNSSHTSNNNNNDDVELMKQNLREEISRLRSEADILKSVMDEYEAIVIKSEEKLFERQIEDATKLIRIKMDENETCDQAERLLSVHNDLKTRVERAQDALKFSDKKEGLLKKTLRRYNTSHSAKQTKIDNFMTAYSKQLNDTLIEHDHQKANYQRKLDKLRCECRLTEMRILSLTQEVKQKDLHNDELKLIRDRILSSPVN